MFYINFIKNVCFWCRKFKWWSPSLDEPTIFQRTYNKWHICKDFTFIGKTLLVKASRSRHGRLSQLIAALQKVSDGPRPFWLPAGNCERWPILRGRHGQPVYIILTILSWWSPRRSSSTLSLDPPNFRPKRPSQNPFPPKERFGEIDSSNNSATRRWADTLLTLSMETPVKVKSCVESSLEQMNEVIDPQFRTVAQIKAKTISSSPLCLS